MKEPPFLSALMAAVALAAAPTAALAQDKKPIELRYTTAAPPKTVWAMQIERFARNVDEESHGSLRVEPFLGSQLGVDQDTVQQVARGRIDMGGFGTTFAALLVPEMSLLSMPLYFKSPAELDCVLDSAMTKPVAEMLAKKGVQFLSWGEAGTIDVVGKRPFVQPGDLNGVKAGTYGTKMFATFWSGMGANPTPTSNTEVGSAFQTGLIDVAGTVAAFYVPSGPGQAGSSTDPHRSRAAADRRPDE